jgi:predicted RNA-binding protein with PUA-like domain
VKSEPWTGVRNYQARNFMKQMAVGDLAFFYHSVTGKEIVGIVKVVRSYYADPTDESGRFGCVDVAAVQALASPVSLEQMKETPALHDMLLLRQSRLSVMPLTQKEWQMILTLGKTAL